MKVFKTQSEQTVGPSIADVFNRSSDTVEQKLKLSLVMRAANN